MKKGSAFLVGLLVGFLVVSLHSKNKQLKVIKTKFNKFEECTGDDALEFIEWYTNECENALQGQ